MDLDFSKLDNIKKDSAKEDFREKEINKVFDKRQEEINKAREVYRKHQENIRKSEVLQSEILKGLREKEDINVLFLKAIEIVGLLTGTEILKPQVATMLNYYDK